jgi:IS30 family transposase
LAHLVASKLCREWWPEQIAGRLKRTYPDDKTHQVSHEIIYRSLFIQVRGALKKELMLGAQFGRERTLGVPIVDPQNRITLVWIVSQTPR